MHPLAALATPDALRARILEAYGSLSTPHFGRVRAPYSGHPYDSLQAVLSRSFAVHDDTDLNENVSRVLVLRRQQSEWVVYLSFLGPFAAVTRVAPDNSASVVESPGDDGESRALFGALSAHDIAVLPPRVLEMPIEITLPYTEPENARFFQALFADYDVLPWHMHAA